MFKTKTKRIIKTLIPPSLRNKIQRVTQSIFYKQTNTAKQALKTDVIESYTEPSIPSTFTVKDGPFAGLMYPSKKSICSKLSPKQIGTYENELHETINLIKKNKYEKIIDIGAAEGYYAIGFALFFPESEVYAYDIDSRSETLVRQMAEFNKVSHRIHIEKICNIDTILNISRQTSQHLLIMCDIEGSECDLLSNINKEIVKKADLIIELHPGRNWSQTVSLINHLRKYYDLKYIPSISSYSKAINLILSQQEINLDTVVDEISEGRTTSSGWIVALRTPQVLQLVNNT